MPLSFFLWICVTQQWKTYMKSVSKSIFSQCLCVQVLCTDEPFSKWPQPHCSPHTSHADRSWWFSFLAVHWTYHIHACECQGLESTRLWHHDVTSRTRCFQAPTEGHEPTWIWIHWVCVCAWSVYSGICDSWWQHSDQTAYSQCLIWEVHSLVSSQVSIFCSIVWVFDNSEGWHVKEVSATGI